MEGLVAELQRLVVRSLRLPREPESLDPDADLFGGALGLDSVDAVQVLVSVERHFSVPISDADLGRYRLDTLRGIARLLADRGIER